MQTALPLSTDQTVSARLADYVDLAARAALAAVFIWSGFDKLFLHTEGSVGYIQAYHLPFAGALVYLAGLLELGAGLLLLVGYKARISALVLALFTVIASVIFHDFWAVPADQALNQTIHFMKNVAIVGGLLGVVAHGTGSLSLERSK